MELEPQITMWQDDAASQIAGLEVRLTWDLDTVLRACSNYRYDASRQCFMPLSPQPDDGLGYAPGGLKHQALMRFAREVRAMQLEIRHTFKMINFCRRYRILSCAWWGDEPIITLPATLPATNGRRPKPHLSNGIPIEVAIRDRLVMLKDEFLRRENLILEELLAC